MASRLLSRSTLALLALPLALAGCREESAARLSRRDLYPLVRTLSREVTVYHWVPRAQAGLPSQGAVDPQDPRVASYLRAKAGEFWKWNPVSHEILGDGLYAANDPVSSRSYGQQEWALVVLRLPPGTRYLDTRAMQAFDSDTLQALDHAGCGATTARGLFSQGGCGKILQDVFPTLHVQAVAYSYGGEELRGCRELRSDAAFLLVDLALVAPPQVAATLVQEVASPDPVAEERARVRELYHRDLYPTSEDPWGDQPPAPVDGAAFEEWMKREIVGCDPGATRLEDLSPDEVRLSWTVLRQRLVAIRERAEAAGQRLGIRIDPLRFKDFIARRFINRPDWESYLARSPSPVEPAEVYSPAPRTWDDWLSVNDSQVERAAGLGESLSIDTLARWNSGALIGTVPPWASGGVLKQTRNYGQNTARSDALSADEVDALSEIDLPWTPLLCREELRLPLQLPGGQGDCRDVYHAAQRHAGSDPFWRQTLADMDAGLLFESESLNKWYWYACWPRLSEEQARQRPLNCGMIAYPEPGGVKDKLQAIVDRVNSYFHGFQTPLSPTAPPAGAVSLSEDDPVAFAAQIQRELVALHPFNKGNGRVSRWVMDYILLRKGLLPVLARDMNHDLSTYGKVYAEQARVGALEGLALMDRCLQRYEALAQSDAAPEAEADALARLARSECGTL